MPQEPQEASSKVPEQHFEIDVEPEQQEATGSTQQTTDDDVDEDLVQVYMCQFKTVSKMKTYMAERGVEILPSFRKKRDMAVALVKDDKARQAKREGKKPQLSAQLPSKEKTASSTESPQDTSSHPFDPAVELGDLVGRIPGLRDEFQQTPPPESTPSVQIAQEASAQFPQDVTETFHDQKDEATTPQEATTESPQDVPQTTTQDTNGESSTQQKATSQSPEDVAQPTLKVKVKPTPTAASATQASGKPLSKKQLRNQKKAEKKGAGKTSKSSGKKKQEEKRDGAKMESVKD